MLPFVTQYQPLLSTIKEKVEPSYKTNHMSTLKEKVESSYKTNHYFAKFLKGLEPAEVPPASRGQGHPTTK